MTNNLANKSVHQRKELIARSLLAFVLSVVAVAGIDILTNEIDIKRQVWDYLYYYDMAARGLSGNENLVAPFAYRYLIPLGIKGMATVTGAAIPALFKAVVYVGGVAQLMLVFLLCTMLGFRSPSSLAAMAVVSFSVVNVKFLCFLPYMPENAGYAFLLGAVMALMARRPVLLALITAVGLQVREFVILPALVFIMQESLTWLKSRKDRRPLYWSLGMAAVVAAAVVIPRALIPVAATMQEVDPLHNWESLKKLYRLPALWKRDINIVYALVAYHLPVLLLLTRQRVAAIRRRLALHAWFLVPYAALVLLLTMYGGTDIMRFVSYLLVPQALMIAALADEGVNRVEFLYMFVAVFLYNRIAFPVPVGDIGAYLDFLGAWDERLTSATLYRIFEMAGWLAGAVAIRFGLARIGPGKHSAQ